MATLNLKTIAVDIKKSAHNSNLNLTFKIKENIANKKDQIEKTSFGFVLGNGPTIIQLDLIDKPFIALFNNTDAELNYDTIECFDETDCLNKAIKIVELLSEIDHILAGKYLNE